MRRTVQSLLARQLLVPSATKSSSPAAATRLLGTSGTLDRLLPINFFMGVEYVCADCRRKLSEGKQQQQRRRTNPRRGIAGGITVASPRKLVVRSLAGLATRSSLQREEGRKDEDEAAGGSIANTGKKKEGLEKQEESLDDDNAIWSLVNTWDKTAFPPPETDWSDFSKYNPVTFAKVREEADVLGTNKLVDKPEMRENFALWRILIAFRKRIHGDTGVMEVWKGLRNRNIDLPTEGEDADAIWRMFISTGLRHPSFEEELLSYAEDLSAQSRGRKQWPLLYDSFMSRYLAVSTRDPITRLHQRLYPVFRPQSWATLFETAIQKRPDCQIWLKEIHNTLPQPAGVYAAVIPTLCAANRYAEAEKWHRHCTSTGDLPQNSEVANPLISWIALHGTFMELRSLLIGLPLSGIPLSESSVVLAVSSRRDPLEVLEIVFSDVVPPNALGDAFWSGLFSTPLSPAQVFKHMLRHGSGWIIGATTVATVARKLARSLDESAALLSQTGLLVHLTPDSLTPDPTPDPTEIHNRRLRHHLSHLHIPAAIRTLGHLRRLRLPIDTSSLLLLSSTLLHPRRKGHKPTTQPHIYPSGDDIDIVALLNLRLHAEGYTIPDAIWTELITRLGQNQRLDDLNRLCLRLAVIYASPRPRTQQAPLRHIFSATTLRSIVEWGLIAGNGAWGVDLLRRLSERGVWVDHRSIKRAVRVRMRGVPEDEVRRMRAEVEAAWGAPLWSDGEAVDPGFERPPPPPPKMATRQGPSHVDYSL
ncbi:hypothetical protein EDC01DRAFT_669756 [Geopyxis carbonaria]|nr:hypothetical protein EDC01DRAFT_669756 [Geopyxis carbonaria]